jgi:hypothetical protein
VGSIHRSVTGFDRDALVGSYRQPLSDLPTDDDVPDYRYFLTGFRNRLTVAMNWGWNYLTFGDSIDHENFRLTDRRRNAGCGPRRSVPWSVVRRCCATSSPLESRQHVRRGNIVEGIVAKS